MKEHVMNLTPAPMQEIRTGNKTIELRLNDEKRKQISVGDTIKFINTEDSNDTLRVKVVDLFLFSSFAELYDNLPLLNCGYNEDNINTASPEDMEMYYSREKQNKYGVVGIEISLL
ncbi:RNA-binding protein [Clostridiaceae bacterium Marseille-Q4149]|jgi:ASC-1-like (ASCH) protein|nr:ASCH domain-containing protein [Oscillospiraceae bacterium]QUO35539.1 RNA-binding protein [Clostridiaceae bacterium Marseille-Q4149]